MPLKPVTQPIQPVQQNLPKAPPLQPLPAPVQEHRAVLEAAQDDLSAPVILIYQDDLNEINSMLGINCASLPDLKTRIASMRNIDIDGMQIQLSTALLTRLKSRCQKQPLRDYLKEVITKQLNLFVGI